MRRAAKRDDNERAIIRTWEALGAYVESLSGPGVPDVLVHHRGSLVRAEVKGAKRGLTKKQVENFTKAYEAGVPTHIIRTYEDAVALLAGYASNHLKWTPEHGALGGAAKKQRAFRPGTDRARTLEECCKREGCAISQVPGQRECAAHAAETFAPPPCPACAIDPQSPCRHDGEEKGVAAGTQPPRRLHRRKVDKIMAERRAAQAESAR